MTLLLWPTTVSHNKLIMHLDDRQMCVCIVKEFVCQSMSFFVVAFSHLLLKVILEGFHDKTIVFH